MCKIYLKQFALHGPNVLWCNSNVAAVQRAGKMQGSSIIFTRFSSRFISRSYSSQSGEVSLTIGLSLSYQRVDMVCGKVKKLAAVKPHSQALITKANEGIEAARRAAMFWPLRCPLPCKRSRTAMTRSPTSRPTPSSDGRRLRSGCCSTVRTQSHV